MRPWAVLETVPYQIRFLPSRPRSSSERALAICPRHLNTCDPSPSQVPSLPTSRQSLPRRTVLAGGSLSSIVSPTCSPSSKMWGLDTHSTCLLYTSDAADDLLCVDLG